MEDSQIIALFFERSEQAIEALEHKYGAPARRLAANILGDGRDAEECMNDAYFALWNTIPPNLPVSLCGYLCRVVRNAAAKRYRANSAQKRNAHFDAALEELAACIPGPEDVESALEAKELAAAINGFLDTLDYTDRFLFLRRYWYGDSLETAAAMARLRPHRASVRLSRVRAKLKQYLKKEGMIP